MNKVSFNDIVRWAAGVEPGESLGDFALRILEATAQDEGVTNAAHLVTVYRMADAGRIVTTLKGSSDDHVNIVGRFDDQYDPRWTDEGAAPSVYLFNTGTILRAEFNPDGKGCVWEITAPVLAEGDEFEQVREGVGNEHWLHGKLVTDANRMIAMDASTLAEFIRDTEKSVIPAGEPTP